MDKIKDIVEKVEIDKKREKVFHNRIIIRELKVKLSDLCYYRAVNKYVYLKEKVKHPDEVTNEELLLMYEELEELKNDKYVIIYNEIYAHIEMLYREISDYYKSIQIDLREELKSLELPSIYVVQRPLKINGIEKEAKHIIDSDDTINYDSDIDGTLVMSNDLKLSKRKNRHFYNQVSFKYLADLAIDHSFNLDNKRIGKVKILTK